jgi:hypothetical protein
MDWFQLDREVHQVFERNRPDLEAAFVGNLQRAIRAEGARAQVAFDDVANRANALVPGGLGIGEGDALRVGEARGPVLEMEVISGHGRLTRA